MLATETSPNPPAHHVGAPATRRRLPPSVRAIPEPNQATMDELSPIVAKMRLPNCPWPWVWPMLAAWRECARLQHNAFSGARALLMGLARVAKLMLAWMGLWRRRVRSNPPKKAMRSPLDRPATGGERRGHADRSQNVSSVAELAEDHPPTPTAELGALPPPGDLNLATCACDSGRLMVPCSPSKPQTRNLDGIETDGPAVPRLAPADTDTLSQQLPSDAHDRTTLPDGVPHVADPVGGSGAGTPPWDVISPWPQIAYGVGPPSGLKNVLQWGSPRSSIVGHYLHRLLASSGLSDERKRTASTDLMRLVRKALRGPEKEPILVLGTKGTFRLSSNWLRANLARPEDVWECDTCAMLSMYNLRGVCPRSGCSGTLGACQYDLLRNNHYRMLYESTSLPPMLNAEEHTAQIDSEVARDRQAKFKSGAIHLLSSSTTFEVGVDLGDLDVVFLRNVPPEPFNYAQRVGRAGRRGTPGLAVTYCRRNPHDLYHYEDPVQRVVEGKVHPPRLRMTNKKIVLRHMVATALSAFFRASEDRFRDVTSFVGDWSNPRGAEELWGFCRGNTALVDALGEVVPREMRERVGIDDGSWIDYIAGRDSRLASVEAELCADRVRMEELIRELVADRKYDRVNRVGTRIKTIEKERVLNFLSRKAVIPKYGFPVDVVELEAGAHAAGGGVALQRDLAQAIAEYAPGGKVVANKLEWESCGVKVIAGRAWPVRHYKYDDARGFEQWQEDDSAVPRGTRKYLIPAYGFVTPLFRNPREPHGRVRRLYTTRLFFQGFGHEPAVKIIHGVEVTKAVPGTLVILCEGRNREGFYICRLCGSHMNGPKSKHRSPSDSECRGTLESFSLGHELVTDVVRLEFPGVCDEWTAYSVAYAVLLGAAEALDVPDADLNVTITRGTSTGEAAIVLYDNVPGGAGLVAQLELESVFGEVVSNARDRVEGNCGCDSSCYGCLRSYRNQFAHPHLDRNRALDVLRSVGSRG